MWHWDQGRLRYFQYDTLREVARFVTQQDWSKTDSSTIREGTGLPFQAPETHSPWRNYLRVFKLCLLVSERDGVAAPTPVADILTQSGAVTCDEYIHFLVEATTDPSPALSGWREFAKDQQVRHPLCFALKYILAKVAGLDEYVTPINEIVGAYVSSGFTGDESDTDFLTLMPKRSTYEAICRGGSDPRQARESIKFISQISYLYSDGSNVITSLSKEDARNIFQEIKPIQGIRENDGNLEIQRLAGLFKDGSEHDFFDYESTIISDVVDSGFVEGSKVKKTHVVIERNSKLRERFFSRTPTSICDACALDTKYKYPWVDRVLDLHHILPLSSGTRVDSKTGTILEDLVPICPTCHRAVHRFYDRHLKTEGRKDFFNEGESRAVYLSAKEKIAKGAFHAE